jgi:RND family efflux transporter MFP subunit
MPPDSLRRTDSRALKHRLRTVGIVVAICAVLIVTYGLVSRAAQTSHLRDQTDERAVPTVVIISPDPAKGEAGLELPGRLQAYISAPIYARVSGYLKDWKHDIGSKVKAGDLLAEIDTPDLDQQLMQARADLSVVQANSKLAEISAKRWQGLAGTDAVSTQDVDQRTFTYDASVAQVKASRANVDRLVAEAGFKRLIAPFDGVVTARDTDIGALINVGAAGGAELFVVSETTKLRVYVDVPQNFVPSVPSGTRATITVPEHPGKTYAGTVEASAQAVSPASGTTLMQIVVDNQNGEMMPGDYATIHLDTPAENGLLSLPSSAVVFNSKGLSVAVLDAQNRVRFKPVMIERDLGSSVVLASGINLTDRVVDSPPDGITDGAEVRLHAPKAASAPDHNPQASQSGTNHG